MAQFEVNLYSNNRNVKIFISKFKILDKKFMIVPDLCLIRYIQIFKLDKFLSTLRNAHLRYLPPNARILPSKSTSTTPNPIFSSRLP